MSTCSPDMPSQTHRWHQHCLPLSSSLPLEKIPSSNEKYLLCCGQFKCSEVNKILSPWPQGILPTREEIANKHKNKCIITQNDDCWGGGAVVDDTIVSDKERSLIKMWLGIQRPFKEMTHALVPSQTTTMLKVMSPEIIQVKKLYKVPTYLRMI